MSNWILVFACFIPWLGGWEEEGGGLLTNCCNWPAGYQLVREWKTSVLPYRELFPAKLSDTLSQKDDKASWVVSNSLTVRQNLLPVLRNHAFPWILCIMDLFWVQPPSSQALIKQTGAKCNSMVGLVASQHKEFANVKLKANEYAISICNLWLLCNFVYLLQNDWGIIEAK